uniref:Uncharacterized protein n=1 Tax=Desulfatirhabdium butyrativorans TaxID=340467 RepID=A0A7C4RTE9_9BACT
MKQKQIIRTIGAFQWRIRVLLTVVLGMWTVTWMSGSVFAYEPATPLTDREILERLTRVEESVKRLEEGLKTLSETVNRGFQANELRFQAMEQRFQAMEQRFQGMEQSFNQRIDQVIQLLIGIVATFGAIVAIAIGFAIWDRRSMIRPFETKTRAIEEEIAKNEDKLHRLLEALRELAKKDAELANVLRSFTLL